MSQALRGKRVNNRNMYPFYQQTDGYDVGGLVFYSPIVLALAPRMPTRECQGFRSVLHVMNRPAMCTSARLVRAWLEEAAVRHRETLTRLKRAEFQEVHSSQTDSGTSERLFEITVTEASMQSNTRNSVNDFFRLFDSATRHELISLRDFLATEQVAAWAASDPAQAAGIEQLFARIKILLERVEQRELKIRVRAEAVSGLN
jgi:hypothetical protein